MTPVRSEAHPMHPGRAVDVIALLAGAWLFVSPWIYGVANASPGSVNSWIFGTMVFLCAAIRIARPVSSGPDWLNVVFALWIVISPWIFGYVYQESRFLNTLSIGVVVFFASIISAHVLPNGTPPEEIKKHGLWPPRRDIEPLEH